jgi:hypothetical protein
MEEKLFQHPQTPTTLILRIFWVNIASHRTQGRKKQSPILFTKTLSHHSQRYESDDLQIGKDSQFKRSCTTYNRFSDLVISAALRVSSVTGIS